MPRKPAPTNHKEIGLNNPLNQDDPQLQGIMDELDDYVNLGPISDEDPSAIPEGVFSDEPPPGFAPMDNPVVGMDAQAAPAPDQPNLRKWAHDQFPKGPGYFAPERDMDPNMVDPRHDQKVVAANRQSLQEDAARAKAAAIRAGAAPPATATTPVRPKANSAHDAREALAGALAADPMAYRSRVTVAAAYRFDGRVREAPEYIDRNWISYDATHPRGPALAVPGVGTVKVGEWLVVQNVLNDDESVAFGEFKIYPDDQFRNLFMPSAPSNAPKNEPAQGQHGKAA